MRCARRPSAKQAAALQLARRLRLPGGLELGLAAPDCVACRGLGVVFRERRAERICGCVWRAVFRACWNRYRYIQGHQGEISANASLSRMRFRDRRPVPGYGWGRRHEEFCADVWLVARRYLSAGLWRVFDLHFLGGLEWEPCCRLLGLDRGNFFHAVYRLERQLGQVFAELRPYALYPVDEYMTGQTHRAVPEVQPESQNSGCRRLTPPLRERIQRAAAA